MKGAAPVLERMISSPTKSSTTTIGVIHQALLWSKKSTNSRSKLGEDCSAWRAKSSDLEGVFAVIRLALVAAGTLCLRDSPDSNSRRSPLSTGENSEKSWGQCGEASSKSSPTDRRPAPSDPGPSASL